MSLLTRRTSNIIVTTTNLVPLPFLENCFRWVLKKISHHQFTTTTATTDALHQQKKSTVPSYNEEESASSADEQQQQQTSSSSSSTTQTEFKRMFKFYKRRNRPLDLTALIDPLNCSTSQNLINVPIRREVLDDVKERINKKMTTATIELRPPADWRVVTFGHRPGLFIVSGVLSQAQQLRWLQRALLEYPEPSNPTNLCVQTHNPYKGDRVFRTCGPDKLRWATLGVDYNWDSKEYAAVARQPLPREMSELATAVVQALGLGPFAPDAAIVNYYPEKAYLSPHVDRSELDLSRPLVSVSLGQPAIYLTGGTTLDDCCPVDALLLRSGDVLVMSGAQRLVYHALPRVLSGHQSFNNGNGNEIEEKVEENEGENGEEKFEEKEEEISTKIVEKKEEKPAVVDPDVLAYANACRVNITIRQVAAKCE